MGDLQLGSGHDKGGNLLKSLSHPCFNGCGGKFTRIHLPVAPACNIQCNYCRRKYECVNESRPGVTAKVLGPQEALERYRAAQDRLGKIHVAGIAGPGDALADFEKTRETFLRIRDHDRDVLLCLSTNGLLLPRYAGEIAALGVSHVTVTVNAVDPGTARRIYRFVNLGEKYLTGLAGAEILLASQYEGIARLSALGIVCKVNIVMLKGLNDGAIPDIVAKVKEQGADLANIMQLVPVAGTIFEHIPLVSRAELAELRKKCEAILPQMYHCRQCRADALGTLEEDLSLEFAGASRPQGALSPCDPAEPETGDSGPLRFAVASKNGIVVDQHFGHARAFFIYQYHKGNVEFIERREASQYCFGKENCGHDDEVLRSLIGMAEDCAGVIAMRIGYEPSRRLAENGIRSFMTYNHVTDAVRESAVRLLREAEEKTEESTDGRIYAGS